MGPQQGLGPSGQNQSPYGSSPGSGYGVNEKAVDNRGQFGSPTQMYGRDSPQSRLSNISGRGGMDDTSYGGRKSGFSDGIGGDVIMDDPKSTKAKDTSSESAIKWSPPDDDNKCIGEVLLTRDPRIAPSSMAEPSSLFGLRVVGGKMSDDGKMAAYVVDVKRGGSADVQAKLQEGDEVMEWNDQSLVDCTFEEVQEIINSTDDSPELHLVLCRDKNKFQPKDNQLSRRGPTTTGSGSPVKRDRASPLTMSGPQDSRSNYGPDRTNGPVGTRMSDQPGFGSQVSDDDYFFGGGPATDSRMVDTAGQKGRLLNGRIQFGGRSLEITIWDYSKIGSSEFIGEIVINMPEANLDGNTYWYPLKTHDENGEPLAPPTPNQSPQSSFRAKGQRGPGELGYGSDYEDESSRYPAPNGMIPGTQGYGPDGDRLHRDSPPNSYNQQIVPDEEERARAAKQKLKELDIDKAKLVIGGSRGRVGYGHAPDHVYRDMTYDSALSPRPGHRSPRMSPVSHPRHAIGPNMMISPNQVESLSF
ncbi:hypothetical protein QZH41_001479 [Actinostola sp. cb2023]|nr:hypothetical protein QZH41_001479 [Actinostola sp. cb2023]